MDGPRSLRERGAGGEDVIHDDAGAPADVGREDRGSCPHRAADASYAVSPPQPLLPTQPSGAGHQCAEVVRNGVKGKCPGRDRPSFAECIGNPASPESSPSVEVPQYEVYRAKTALPERAAGGGNRDQAESLHVSCCSMDGSSQPSGQYRFELALAVLLERQQGLCEFLSINAGGNHRQDD